jgi:outer membrane protein assembly factor BamA
LRSLAFGIAIAASIMTLLSIEGCASAVPKGRYGVASVEIRGAEKLDDQALLTCLATRERERFGFTLGAGQSPQCGVPPFDASRTPVHLWTWPWSEWPLLNDSAFERDLDRVERWYVARGYYDARVVMPMTTIEKNADERTAEVRITVDEGEPALIFSLKLKGDEALAPGVREALQDAIALELGEPFDEALHEQTKATLERVLFDSSYARAAVSGVVRVDVDKKLVRVEYTVVPGPPCTFGNVSVTGNGKLSSRVIRAAAGIKPGSPFSLEAVRDAQRAIYALGPFASVDIERDLRGESAIVDLIVHVVPGRPVRFGFGLGFEVGGIHTQEGEDSTGDFALWDAHLLARAEHRNFLGGMRRLRVEDRPRLVFDVPFPGIDPDRTSVGNLLTIELRQPRRVIASASVNGSNCARICS